MEGTTSVLDALRRSGFSDATLAMFFEEERIGGARNSGLMEHLAARADQFACLLYAFHGLRTLTLGGHPKPAIGGHLKTGQ
jgi:hypothetical protein